MNWRKRFTVQYSVVILLLAFALFIVNPAQAGQKNLPGPPEHANATDNAAQNNHNTVVQTEYGKLRGYVNEGRTLVWKGVPYAKPPVGELRWMAPQDPDSWNGVREAIFPAQECTQLLTTREWIRTGEAVGSEDCLYVDIYRPQRPAYHREQLPVYVWIHGGSNNFGSAKLYDGGVLAQRSDVVVVVLQYRLGPLGWFYHPAVQTGGADMLSDSGNLGTLDHAQALKWIRDNIAAFGGDPDNVTITGESAGAHNVMNMVVSSRGKDLFHRAMSQSGGMTTKTPAIARGLANGTIERVLRYKEGLSAAEAAQRRIDMENAGTLEAYLRSTDAKTFFLAIIKYGTIGTYDGIQDGMVIPAGGWIATIREGKHNMVPIILGSNEYESKAFMPLYGPTVKSYFAVPSSTYSWFNLIDVLKGNLTLDAVLPTQADRDLYEIAGKYGSRNWRAKFVDTLANELAQVQDNVYAYLFKWGGIGSGPSPFDFIYGAGHAMEIPFFFGEDQDLFGYSFTPQNETGRKDLQAAMMEYLAQFVRTDNPNPLGSNLPLWEEWSNGAGAPKAIVFDADPQQKQIAMTSEELTVQGVTAELLGAINPLPPNAKAAALFFQWQAPW